MRAVALAALVAAVVPFAGSARAEPASGFRYLANQNDQKSCRSTACKRRMCRSRACRERVELKRWRRLQRQLSPATKAMLARLRGCETRGLAFPANYRYRGQYRGAYQYTFSTWARAGGHGDPADASAAEQDVRTARFYPSHRGEWGCAA
jgi:hypothetical protein